MCEQRVRDKCPDRRGLEGDTQPGEDHGCCTGTRSTIRSARPCSTFYLQNRNLFEWAMLGSNQRPLPCEGSALDRPHGGRASGCVNNEFVISVPIEEA